MAIYIVKKGDTLSKIANDNGISVSTILTLNHISDPSHIAIGQSLRLSSDDPDLYKRSQSRPVVNTFGIRPDTDRNFIAIWEWDRSNTNEYQYIWYYADTNGIWYIGDQSSTIDKKSEYIPPTTAKKVKFRVKAISKKYIVNDMEVEYWTSQWSTDREVPIGISLTIPPTPNVKIENYTLTVSIENLNVNGNSIEFEIYKDDSSRFKLVKVNINSTRVVYSTSVDPGARYKVRCRTVQGTLYSEWSAFSANYSTIPKASSGITYIKAVSQTEVVLEWAAVDGAENYEVEYTTNQDYFDSSDQTTTVTIESSVARHAEITGLEIGNTYYFRVRSTNQNGKSAWTPIRSIVLGKRPTAPTTWSSTTRGVIGDLLQLFWIHNSEDGSSERYAKIELNINGVITTQEIQNTNNDPETNTLRSYAIDTSLYTEGTIIKWRVMTRGLINEYSDWSTQRVIEVYAQPTLEIDILDSNDEAILEGLKSFPFSIRGTAGPNSQKPIGYTINIVAGNSYESSDRMGNKTIINKGDIVYTNFFDINSDLLITLSAGDVILENNINYTLNAIVSMDSGLTAEASYEFTVLWEDDMYEPNASIIYDPNTYTININPFCQDEQDQFIEGLIYSVYRINYDSTLTEIATGIKDNETFVTDPHPSLNYARYRIIAISELTGSVSYFDMPGEFIGEIGIIIQWEEEWKDFTINGQDALEEKPWTGSLLRLPYNIDTTENTSRDVSLVEYIGRENPVSYYGTQVGMTSTWNTDIPMYDEETIYALRRLSRWMGNVYVREPSGIGYWANIEVSLSRKHLETVIPVTLNVKKVEGGM